MKLEDIYAEWEKDQEVDYLNLVKVNEATPRLCGKYNKMINTEKLLKLRLEKEKAELVVLKKEYYLGILPKDKLDEKNWIPFGRKILKSELDDFLAKDSDLFRLIEQIAIQDIKIDTIKSYIKNIESRVTASWSIAKDRHYFENGGGL